MSIRGGLENGVFLGRVSILGLYHLIAFHLDLLHHKARLFLYHDQRVYPVSCYPLLPWFTHSMVDFAPPFTKFQLSHIHKKK